MNKKNNLNIFWKILFILFVIYVAIYISVANGYNETVTANKTLMTEEKLKEFEEDVKNNKEIDIKDYLEDEYKDYRSPTSNMAVKLSKRMEKTLSGTVETSIKIFKMLFT